MLKNRHLFAYLVLSLIEGLVNRSAEVVGIFDGLHALDASERCFQLVYGVADSRYPRDGRFIEEIGYYNPITEPAEIKIDAEKAKKWIANGAQPTDTVKSLLKRSNIVD